MKSVKFTEREKHLLFDLILDNAPDDESKMMEYVTIYNKIAGVWK